MKNKEILEIVNSKIHEIADEFEIDLNTDTDTIFVYSEKGTFDSMMLVALISEIEQELLINGLDVSLTSDKAMSRNTPFESNMSILNLLNEIIV